MNKKLSTKEILNQKCKSDHCTAADCCKEGWKRKCSNTDNKGRKKPFKEEMCDNGYTLHSIKRRKKEKCTGSNGKKCLSENCCKKKRQNKND